MPITGINNGDHILVFPYPAQGHMLSLLDLTHQLATRGGLQITILITPKNLPTLTPLLSAHPTTITTLVLPLPPHPAIPSGIENAKDIPGGGFPALILALGDLYNPIKDWFQNHHNPPVAIVSDLFLGWTHRLAVELGVRRYCFSPCGTLAISVMFYLWRYQPKRVDTKNENEVIKFSKIPNSPEFPWWQISPMYRSYLQGDATLVFVKDVFLDNMASWGLIINSFTELEGVYVEYLKTELGHDRVFAVGPLLPPDNNITQRGGPSSNDVLSWLDKCQDHTVVYVCFGSQLVLTNKQTEAVALGLEKSGVNFVWSVKEPTVGHVAGNYGKIPGGFEERVAGRGFVVRGWAPQVAILNHHSVGATLFHCGWNSIMEALVSDVDLLLTWPMGTDNYSNAKLLHHLKVGIKACVGPDAIPDSEEFAELFRKSVSKDTQLVERERSKKLTIAAQEAIGENGSSIKKLNMLMANFSREKVNECQ